jgi:predicted nucleic acid-binding protein
MILIDSNALVLLMLGLVDPNQIEKHRRTSLYTKKDFQDLLIVIHNWNRLIVLPNIWTEVDNLLNNFLNGNFKWPYINAVKEVVSQSTERYLNSESGVNSDYFLKIGLTDSLIIELGKECDLLITADSELSDIARAHGITVYDLVERKNREFK